MTRLVLGSASTGRLSVLRQAGVDPLVIVSGVDEDAIIAEHAGAPPEEVVCALAAAKADEVAAGLPADVRADCVVVGCDSMLLIDDRLCGKPATAEAARTQWRSMAARPGRLLTGHAVLRIEQGDIIQRDAVCAATTVHFGTPQPSDLDAYIAQGEPLGVAGGFTMDGLGGWFVDQIEGDASNVIGISLPLMRELLLRMGVSIASLWSANRTKP
jgi:septum formation protein